MTRDINEIKDMVRDFYHAKMEVSIDGDDLEPFFLSNDHLLALDNEEFDLWNRPWERVCNKTNGELDSLRKNYGVERLLFLAFQPIGHELNLPDMDCFRPICKSSDSIVWGVCSWYEDPARLVTLVETKSKLCINIE